MTAEYQYAIDTGLIVADTKDMLSDVQAEYRDALGQTLDVDASTPQGTIIAAETIARTAVMKNNVEVANMLNPNYSYGVFLDAIAALLGIDRGRNRSSVANSLTINGDPNTVITAGLRVQSAAGDIWSIATDVTIPAGRVAMATLVSAQYGNIPLAVGRLTILDGVIGWGSIDATVSTSVIPGDVAVDDGRLKNLRNARLFAQGIGSAGAVRAAVLNVPNVTSCRVVENNTGAAGTIAGITFTTTSGMYVCVAGNPNPNDVAAALHRAHQGGCPWSYGAAGQGVQVSAPNGVGTIDPWTGQLYNAKWTTPVMFDVYVRFEIRAGTTTSDPEPAIRNAVLKYASGQMDGEEGFAVGASVSSYELSGAVARDVPGLYIKRAQVCVLAKGSPAPIYPTGYVDEVALRPFDQASITFGQILVVPVA